MANQKKIFSKIYDKYIDKIYRFIFLKVNSKEITQDLCSETFLRGWESFKNGNKIQNNQAFLYKIARNLVIDHYREKGKTQIVSADYVNITDPYQDLEEKAILDSDLDTIKIGLAGLKEDYQNVIIWRYLDDLPMREIAKMMDKSEEATRMLLSRALKSLRGQVREN